MVMTKEEITDVARVGVLPGGEYAVYVKTDDELKIPHVHIWDNATNGKRFDSSLTLPDYQSLSHGHSTDIMSSELFMTFSNFMQQPCRTLHYQSNLEFAQEMWRDNNDE